MKIALCVESHGDETQKFVDFINSTTSHTASVSRTNTDAVDGIALSCCSDDVVAAVDSLLVAYCN